MGRIWKRVLVGPKVDLDTCGCAFLMGVTREEGVEVVRSGRASEADLADSSVLCIEVGGSGQVDRVDFDHHESGGPVESATAQARSWLGQEAGYEFFQRHNITISDDGEEAGSQVASLVSLIQYIDELDTKGPQALGREPRGEEFPYFSDVFAGMLLTERNPVEQLHKGVQILKDLVQRGQDPYGTIKGFDLYAEAKAENNRQVTKAVESARWTNTKAGRKVGYLETDFFGAPGVLFGAGAEIAVAFSPRFGNPPVPKFTIAGNGVRVDEVLSALNALEQGWGGPATGTILGSPRSGSSLTLEQVVEIVRKNL